MSSVQLRPAPNPSAEPTVSVGRLFEEYSDRIYGYCLRQLRNPSDAEDAVQMTFLCAHRAVQRGIVPASENAWLFAIAKNVCKWQQRTIFRRNRLLTDAELDSLATPPHSEDEDLLSGLKDALASIPDTQRRALVLREWRGLSSSEVASQLGMSQPATYALLTRARRSLAHALTALPQQAALALVALVYEARSHVKALFGSGAAVKTVAATTVVAAVAVGGVAVERAVGGYRGAPSAPAPESRLVDPGSDVWSEGATSVPSPVRDAGSSPASARGSSGSSVATISSESGPVAQQTTPSSPTGDVVVPATPRPGDTLPDLAKLPVAVPEPPPLPLPLPPLPPLPTDLLPPVPELPPIPEPSLPPVDLPLPPIEPPAVPPLPEPPLPKLP